MINRGMDLLPLRNLECDEVGANLDQVTSETWHKRGSMQG